MCDGLGRTIKSLVGGCKEGGGAPAPRRHGDMEKGAAWEAGAGRGPGPQFLVQGHSSRISWSRLSGCQRPGGVGSLTAIWGDGGAEDRVGLCAIRHYIIGGGGWWLGWFVGGRLRGLRGLRLPGTVTRVSRCVWSSSFRC